MKIYNFIFVCVSSLWVHELATLTAGAGEPESAKDKPVAVSPLQTLPMDFVSLGQTLQAIREGAPAIIDSFQIAALYATAQSQLEHYSGEPKTAQPMKPFRPVVGPKLTSASSFIPPLPNFEKIPFWSLGKQATTWSEAQYEDNPVLEEILRTNREVGKFAREEYLQLARSLARADGRVEASSCESLCNPNFSSDKRIPLLIDESLPPELKAAMGHWNKLIQLSHELPAPAADLGWVTLADAMLAEVSSLRLQTLSLLYGSEQVKAVVTSNHAAAEMALQNFMQFAELEKQILRLKETLLYRDQAKSTHQQIRNNIQASLREMCRLTSDFIDPATNDAQRTTMEEAFEQQEVSLKNNIKYLLIFEARSQVNGHIEQECLGSIRNMIAVCEQTLVDQWRFAIAARLAGELDVWKKAKLVADIDLTLPKTESALSSGHAKIAEALQGCFSKANRVQITVANLLPNWDGEKFDRVELNSDKLKELLSNAGRNIPAGTEPVFVEIQAHTLHLKGNIDFTKPFGDRPTHILIMADHIDINGFTGHVGNATTLTMLAHQLTATPNLHATSPIHPQLMTSGDGRIQIHTANGSNHPNLISCFGPTDSILLCKDLDGQRNWQAYLQSALPNVSEGLANFYSNTVTTLINWHIHNDTQSTDEVRALKLARILSIPRIVVTPNEASREADRLLDRYSNSLLQERIVSFYDHQLQMLFHYRIVRKPHGLEASLLPDTVEIIENPQGALGTIVLNPHGAFSIGIQVRPAISRKAKEFGKKVLLAHLPSAIYTEQQWRSYRLNWPQAVVLRNGESLQMDRREAWDFHQAASMLSIQNLTTDGVDSLSNTLRSGENSIVVSMEDTERNEEIGEFTLRFSLANVELRQPVTINLDPANGVTLNNPSGWPVKIRSVHAGNSPLMQTAFELSEGSSSLGEITAQETGPLWCDAELDLDKVPNAAIFRVAKGEALGAASIELDGIQIARFPGTDGTVGAGKYIDLTRSRILITPIDEQRRPYPGGGWTLEEFYRSFPDWQIEFPVINQMQLKIELELYPADSSGPPTLITRTLPDLDTPDRRGMELHWLKRELEAELSAKAAH